MKSLNTCALAALLLAAPAGAAAVVDVNSNVPSDVYLDGTKVGATPMTVKGATPGNHTIRVEDKSTKTAQFFEFENPVNADVQKSFLATFVPATKREVVVERTVTVPTVEKEVIVVPRMVVPQVEREIYVYQPRTETVTTYVHNDFPLISEYLEDREVGRTYRSYDRTYDRSYDLNRRDRVRTRNTALGVTGLGLLSGSSLLTGFGLGGLVVNEMR